MAYRIISTTDGQHVGEILQSIDKGNLITFPDGDVVSIDDVIETEDKAIIISPNYHITLIKE